MRKITKLTRDAIQSQSNFKRANTEVHITCNGLSSVYLHNHCIAQYDHETKETQINLCGWNTPTTRERLKAVGVRVSQRKGLLYLLDNESNCMLIADNEWIEVQPDQICDYLLNL